MTDRGSHYCHTAEAGGKIDRSRLTQVHSGPNVQKPHHTHTLKGFRPAHLTPLKGAEPTGQIVRSLNRTYHLLPTVLRKLLARVGEYGYRRRQALIAILSVLASSLDYRAPDASRVLLRGGLAIIAWLLCYG